MLAQDTGFDLVNHRYRLEVGHDFTQLRTVKIANADRTELTGLVGFLQRPVSPQVVLHRPVDQHQVKVVQPGLSEGIVDP